MALTVTLKDTSGQEDVTIYPQTSWGIIANKPQWLVTAEAYGGITITGLTTNLSLADQQTVRTNIGASNFSGNYTDLAYTIETESVSGDVTVNGAIPLYVLTATANISSISFATGVPADKHSCHLIITSTAARTVTLAHGSTVTINGTTYTFKCPEASDVALDIQANGYIELDLLRIGNNIYVRGV